MNFLLNVLKGIMIGIANVIPGVSGGTMAVSLGIYDRLLGSISGLFKHLKESLAFLFPILLGCAIGIVGFTYAIEYLLSNHTFVTCMAFVGLILGGLPMLWKSMRKELKESRSSIGVSGVLFFLLGLLVCGGFPLLKAGDEAMTVIAVTPLNMLILFVLGVVASATMVIPGVSGSMMLMIFGYYYGIIGTIKGFLDGVRALDFTVMRDGFLLLFPFGIGVLLGIFLIANPDTVVSPHQLRPVQGRAEQGHRRSLEDQVLRMGVKGDRRRDGPQLGRHLPHPAQKGSVPQVDAVKEAQRDHTSFLLHSPTPRKNF